jgi:predicted ATPase
MQKRIEDFKQHVIETAGEHSGTNSIYDLIDTIIEEWPQNRHELTKIENEYIELVDNRLDQIRELAYQIDSLLGELNPEE